MEFFRKSFLDWLDQDGFWVKDSWDYDKKRWVGPGKLELMPFQRRIFEYILTPREDGSFKYSTVLYSTTKKSGKTACGAMVGSWFAENAPGGTEIYTIANDQEQAEGRMMRDIKYHAKRVKNEDDDERDVQVHKITNYDITYQNDTFIRALAQSYRSSAGSRHALTLFDELWGYL